METQFSFDRSNLHGNPFDRTLAADHPYLSSSFQEALAAVYYGLEYGSRILIVSAARGIGKTTLLRYLERRLRDRGATLLLSLGHENGREVLCKLLSQIGGIPTSDDLSIVREQVDTTLVQIAKPDKPFMLLLDYNEDGTGSTLDVLRNFATLESIEKGVLRVVIAGGPQVAEQFRLSDLTDEIISISRLTASEVRNYIDHRLRLVGWNGVPLFTAKAYTWIAEKSSGRPSTINEICYNLLQSPSDLNGAHPAGRVDEEGLLDQSYVESFLSDHRFPNHEVLRDDRVTPPSLSPNNRTAVLACVVIVILMAIAGLWYRSATKAHATKHPTARAPGSTAHLQHAAFHDGIRGRLPTTPATPVKAAGAAVKSTLTDGSGAVKTASRLAQDKEPAGSSSMKSPASAIASRTNTTSRDNMIDAHRADSTSSSAGTATPNQPRQHSTGDIAKQPQEVMTAPPSSIAGANRDSTSSSLLPHKTLVHEITAPTEPAVEVKNDGSAAKEMATYQIRLGDAYMNLGDYERARSCFSRALGLAPDNKAALDKVRRADRARAAEESVLR